MKASSKLHYSAPPLIKSEPEVLEMVSVRSKTVADRTREKELGKLPQIEKDIADFNFKDLTRGTTES